MDVLVKALAVLPLVAAHLFADRLRALAPEARLRFSSFAAGAAAAYVFLLVLPKLADQQQLFERATSAWPPLEYLYHHAYLGALAGFATYYLVNVLAQYTDEALLRAGRVRGLVVVAGLCAYSAVLGDLVATVQPDVLPSALLSVALALHLLGMDFDVYKRLSRSWSWLRPLLVASLLLGWIVGAAGVMPPVTNALLSAWLAGGIILHVVALELPEERRAWAFFSGVLTFAVLYKAALTLLGREGGV